jgi:hypothetical protein
MIETSNMFVGFQEQETTQQADKSQRKHRRQPNFDVHRCVPWIPDSPGGGLFKCNGGRRQQSLVFLDSVFGGHGAC